MALRMVSLSVLAPAQREMAKRAGSTVVEAAGSHAIYVSKPEVVAALIKQAAEATRIGA